MQANANKNEKDIIIGNRIMTTISYKNIDSLIELLKSGETVYNVSLPTGQVVKIDCSNKAIKLRDIAVKEQEYVLAKCYNRIIGIYDLFEKRSVYRHYPMVLQLEHTSYCNAECIMCMHYYKQNNDAHHLSSELLTRIEPIFPYLEEIVLHGNGEPFMMPELGSVLSKYKEYCIKVSTNTNMSILPQSVIDNIDIFHNVSVSLDSPRKEVYEKIRRNLDFDKVTANIDKFRSCAPNTFMTLAVVSMRQNIYDCKRLVEYAVEHGFNRIMFSRLGINGYIKNYYDDVMCYPVTLRKNMCEAISYAKSKEIEIVYPDVFLENKDGNEEEERKIIESYPVTITEEQLAELRSVVASTSKRGELYWDMNDLKPSKYSCSGLCDLVWNDLMITAKGQVIVCCIDVVHHIGVLDRDFWRIWNSDKLIKLRDMFLHKNILPEFCRNCLFVLNGGLKYLKVDVGDGFYINTK